MELVYFLNYLKQKYPKYHKTWYDIINNINNEGYVQIRSSGLSRYERNKILDFGKKILEENTSYSILRNNHGLFFIDKKTRQAVKSNFDFTDKKPLKKVVNKKKQAEPKPKPKQAEELKPEVKLDVVVKKVSTRIKKVETLPATVAIKETEPTIYEQIIFYLNQKLNTKYRPNTKQTHYLINQRLKEGFVLADFITVIDNKYNHWFGTEQHQYLTPDTLFSGKFEKYLNTPILTKTDMEKVSILKREQEEAERQRLIHENIIRNQRRKHAGE